MSNIGHFVHRVRLLTTGKMSHKDELNDVKTCLVVREVSICIMKQDTECIPVSQVSSLGPSELQEVSLK